MIIRFLFLFLILGIILFFNLCLGEIVLSPIQVLQTVFPQFFPANSIDIGIIDLFWQIRLPRIFAAFIVGAALAVSGFLLQTLSRNELADPYLTGVSSGAGLAVAIAIILGMNFSLLPIIALSGGLLASILVAGMAHIPGGISITKLLLAGIAISAIASSIITLILINSNTTSSAQGLFLWLAGSIAGKSWDEILPSSIYTSLGIFAAFVMSKAIRLLNLGTQIAASLGLNVAISQWTILFIAAILCGTSVALAGIVGFVGLIGPYLARYLFGNNERILIVVSAIIGGILVLISDLAARTLGQGQELPLSTLLSLFGGPFFLILVLKQRGENI